MLNRFLPPGIPTTIKTMGVNITTIDYLRILIIEIGSTIILMVVEAQGTKNLKSIVEKQEFIQVIQCCIFSPLFGELFVIARRCWTPNQPVPAAFVVHEFPWQELLETYARLLVHCLEAFHAAAGIDWYRKDTSQEPRKKGVPGWLGYISDYILLPIYIYIQGLYHKTMK